MVYYTDLFSYFEPTLYFWDKSYVVMLFNFYAEHIMRNAGLEEAQLESRLPGEISVTSDMQMTPPLWQKVKKN